METLGKFTAIVGGFVILICLAPLIGVLGGAFAGWIVSLLGFEPVVLDLPARFGANVSGWHLWQVGAAMGFFGGFLKTNVSSGRTND